MTDSFHILVIDDDDVDRMAVRRALKSAAMTTEVDEAADGATAIALLKTRRFDCVLLDHHLPDRDGLTVLREIRAAGITTPIIMMTGQGSEELAVDMMKAGATDYLPKSRISHDHLFQMIRSATRVHLAESRASDAVTQLTRGQEQYRFLAESIPQMVWTALPTGALDYYNRRVSDYGGIPIDQLIGAGWTAMLHPDDLERAVNRWQQSLTTGDDYETEFRLRDTEGRYRWHLVRALPMRDADGNIVKWFGTCTDIDDQKQAEADLKQSRDAAEAANNAKDQFLAVLSHELRTPLMPVLTTAAALEMEADLPESVRSGLQIIRRNVELEARLIDDLLDLTRVSKGKLQLNLETTDVYHALHTALEICRPDIESKKLTVAMDLTKGLCPVRADPARLQQIFWNLISNAVKFTPQGGTLTFRCRAVAVADGRSRVRLEVTDTGVGIEPAALSRIFDAFEQGGQSVARIFGGLGLGLAISKALVTLHGGTIAALSEGKDKGSTFTVELPLNSEAATNPPACDPPPPAASLDAREIRILLVDDHEDTNRAMQRLLQRLGYDVQTAHTVQSALDAANVDPPFDLLISDIGLPDGSGLELMEQLLKRRPIKGIALSGFGMEEDVKKSKQAGFFEHLTKPINFKRLETAIKQLTTP